MRARDLVGRRIVGLEQVRPPSATYGAEHALVALRLDNGATLLLFAVEDPTVADGLRRDTAVQIARRECFK